MRDNSREFPIYSVGYEHRSAAEIDALSKQLGATVIDVRARMSRTKSGFGKLQLTALLGDRYQWRGDTLGGFGLDTTAGRLLLTAIGKPTILLCKEDWPGECHRFKTIAWPLLYSALDGCPRNVAHIWRAEPGQPDLVLRTDELDEAGEPLTDDEAMTLEDYIQARPVKAA
jgi:hypothetical protein